MNQRNMRRLGRRPASSLRIERFESRDLPSIGYYPPTYFRAEPVQSTEQFIASPRPSALDIGRAYLINHADAFHLTPADLTNSKVTSQYTDQDTGYTHIYLRQTVGGLEVQYADLNVAVAADGHVISAAGGFVAGLAQRVPDVGSVTLSLDPESAVKQAATLLRLSVSGPTTTIESASGADHHAVISAPGISFDDIPVNLQYVPTPDGGAELSWQMVIQTRDGNHWYDLSVGDKSGQLAALNDWIDNDTYNSVPLPNESPQDGGFAIDTNPADPTASPFGWQDTNGVAGAEFTDTRGNNVDAHLDVDANNVPDPSPARPDGGPSINFSGFTFDSTQEPNVLQNQNIAMLNLFHMNNVLHDIHYKYGFTEAAGNFQVNNYGKGGLANDAVQADAQDGSGTNNANFGTPVDGSAPRMQQYIFTLTSPNRDSDLDNGVIIHEYGHGVSNRLTGGPGNSSALNALQSGGMGEGWSDFYALMLMQRGTDLQNDAYPIGTYVLGQPANGPGIRRKPYSYDMSIDPLTFDAYGTSGTTSYGITRSTEVHNSGELWATTLWDANWQLINKYGYDSNLYTGYTISVGPGHAGNKLMLKLVMDAMKLQPANPSFLDARDAIIAADVNLNGGQDLLELWTAFARRGLGKYASTSNSNSTSFTPDFTLPPELTNLVVFSTVPAQGVVVASKPASYVLNMSGPVDPITLQANDLQVNGLPATSVSYTPGNTSISFTFASDPVTAQGLQSIHVNAGAFTQTDGKTLLQYDGNFRYDTLVQVVTSTSPANGASVILPLTTIDVNLNEAVDPASVAATDLVLSQGAATSFSLLNSNQTIRFTVGGIVNEGTFTATLGAGAITDPVGNPLAAGYTSTYQLDYATRAYPLPLNPVGPLGQQLYQGSATGLINTSADTDDFTLNLNVGQSITLRLSPDTVLRPRITLLSPSLGTVADVTASAAGKFAISQGTIINTPGIWTLRVRSAGVTTGAYTLQVNLNSTLEAEGFAGGAANNTAATAQTVNTGLITTTTSVGSTTRTAVVGATDAHPGYSAATASFSFEDISATGATILTSVDDSAAAVSIPFAFNFYGVDYTTVYPSSNGLVTFGNGALDYFNGDLTTAPTPPAIAAFWDDLVTGGDGVKWEVRGTGTSRRLIVQWQNVRFYDGTDLTLQFQAVLFEGSNQVRINYANLNGNLPGHDEGGSATVGVRNTGGTAILLLANNNGPNTFVGTGKSTVLTPLPLVPDYYSFSLAAGQTVSLAAESLGASPVNLQLLASNGTTVLATGAAGASNFDRGIQSYVVGTAGTYFATITGAPGNTYSLSVVTNAAFDAEPNSTAATAQSLGTTRGVYGFVAPAPAPILSNFESGAGTWTVNNNIRGTGTSAGLWNISNRRGAEAGHSQTMSFYYGNAGTYDTGAANAGSITSAPFLASGNAAVSFNYVLQTENPTNYDTADLQITTNGGATWTTLLGRSTTPALDNVGAWTPISASLAAYDGQVVQIRFIFDTLDAVANGFEGWLVDDVNITGTSNDDWYTVTVQPGQNTLKIESATPSDGAGQFPNTLDPAIQLYNAAGTTLLASGTPLPDGRNETLTINGLAAGTYAIHVSAGGANSGEYVLHSAASFVAPPQVSNVVVNNGAVQRSRVTAVTVNFSQHVSFSGTAVSAFTLKRQSDNAIPAMNALVDDTGPGTAVTLTFTGATAVDFSSLADGRYTLTVDASKVSAATGQLDGDGNGIGGDNYTLVGNPALAPQLFRLYGDADGNGIVDGVDFGAFRTAFNTNDATFDFDGSGIVDGLDFGRFRQDFGLMI